MFLECPFCGSPDVKQHDHITYGHGDSTCEVYVQCNKCRARGPDTGYWGHPEPRQKQEAIAKWNTRTPPEPRLSIKPVSRGT